jgi:hypothetical protein
MRSGCARRDRFLRLADGSDGSLRRQTERQQKVGSGSVEKLSHLLKSGPDPAEAADSFQFIKP